MTIAVLNDFLIESCRSNVGDFIENAMLDERGLPLRQGEIHECLQEFIQESQQGVVEFPREHGKTTQMIGFAAWAVGNNVNLRIKIVSSTDGLAIARGRAIMALMETPFYQAVFPHVVPGRVWTASQMIVERDIITPEPTIECCGLYSRGTGGRADLIFLDDPDDEEVVTSETKRERNWERVANVWINLLTPDGKCFLFCTPWHKKDIAHKMKANGVPVLRFPIDGTCPIWPERWNEEKLLARKEFIGSLAYARGYNLKPVDSATRVIFDEYVQYYAAMPAPADVAGVCIAVDPANSLQLDADYTCIGALMAVKPNKCYLLDVVRERWKFPDLLRALKDFAMTISVRYGMKPTIGIESVAFQNALTEQMKAESPWPIVAVRADKSKFIRASRLAVHMENGRVFFRGRKKPGESGQLMVCADQQCVYDECLEYPAGDHDDALDMLAYGVELCLDLEGLKWKSGWV